MNPLIAIVGLDPDNHEIPLLLQHYLRKMQKDFCITFIGPDELSEPKTLNTLKDLLARTKFVPTERKRILNGQGLPT
jgi:hypothetical protein